MSANVNVTNANRKKKVLIVAANHSTSPTTGWPVGFWWAELTHAYWAFTEAGYEVEIRSPQGGALVADSYSDPEDSSGYSAHDILSLGFKKSPKHFDLLQNTGSIDEVDPQNYDAVFFAGGQSPMVTFRGNEKLQRLVAAFYEAGKMTALVCHATCLLLETKLSNGACQRRIAASGVCRLRPPGLFSFRQQQDCSAVRLQAAITNMPHGG